MTTWKERRIIKKWIRRGKKIPPPHVVKQSILRSYQYKHQLNTFVETGTFRGEMLLALNKDFKELYSIELNEELYKKCVETLASYSHIHLFQGDSSKILPDIVSQLSAPALFWLDSHYSGGITSKGESETPILKELDTILKKNEKHIILIDDARCFGNPDHPEYPSLDELRDFIQKYNKFYSMDIKDDVIRIF